MIVKDSPEMKLLADILCHSKQDTISININQGDGHDHGIIGYSQSQDLLRKLDSIRQKYCPETDSY